MPKGEGAGGSKDFEGGQMVLRKAEGDQSSIIKFKGRTVKNDC